MKIEKRQRGVEDYLPEEIVEQILSKLRAHDVIRCSAVCKLWNSLVNDRTFIQTHLKNQTRGGVSELLLLSSYQSDDLHWDSPPALFGQHHSNLCNPIYNKNNGYWTRDIRFRVVGTDNGLVCLYLYSCGRAPLPCPPAILWNPSIRKFGFLPDPPQLAGVDFWIEASWCFCYDSRIDDYMVVRVGETTRRGVEIDIWSLAWGGAWKSLLSKDNNNNSVPASVYLNRKYHAFVNGAFHWVQVQYEEDGDLVVSIVAVDMVDESFSTLEIPQGWSRTSAPMISRYYHGGGGGGGDHQCCLALFELHRNFKWFNLWVMKEYGVGKSWTKLFSMRPPGSLGENPQIKPFGFTQSGKLVVKMGCGGSLNSFKSYDPEDKQFGDFGSQARDYYYMDSFVESLVLLGQANVFSY